MDHITVRRWVAASPADVYKHLGDLEAALAHHPGFAVAEPFAETPALCSGDAAVLTHRSGHRTTRLRLEIATDQEPHHLTAALTAPSSRWLLTVEILPLDDGMSDLCLRASPEAAGSATHRLTLAPTIAHRRATEAVGSLLEVLADHVEGHAR